MKLTFTKMQGAGNDFIVIDAINQQVALTAELCVRLADRRFGIGADQILVVERPDGADCADCDFRYRIYNQDGGEVEQCGNGARAFVKFVTDQGLTRKSTIRVRTMKGIISVRLEADGNVTVDMGAPELAAAAVPFETAGLDGRTEGADTLWPLELGDDKTVWVSVLSMGNPHAVQVVEDVDAAAVAETGPLIERHRRFAQRVNAGYMQVLTRRHIRLRVYERGAGETLACGTGACAAAVAGIRRGLLDSPVRVGARGGDLVVAWEGEGRPVLLSGPALTVFEGVITV